MNDSVLFFFSDSLKPCSEGCWGKSCHFGVSYTCIWSIFDTGPEQSLVLFDFGLG